MPHGSDPYRRAASRTFFIVFRVVIGAWLCVMMCGTYVWNLCLAYYRVLGIGMRCLIIGVAGLCWLALAKRGTSASPWRRSVLIAVGLKFAHWCYYVPEWNYRVQPGPLGSRHRAVGPAQMDDLYDPARRGPPTWHSSRSGKCDSCTSPHYLEYQDGDATKFVLLLPSEFENWPSSAAAGHAGGQVSGSIGRRAHPGPHARPRSPAPGSRPRLADSCFERTASGILTGSSTAVEQRFGRPPRRSPLATH